MEALSTTPSYQPLYNQIKVLLTQSLMRGEWRAGEMIPSEVELALRFQVSQGTVRKAIDALAGENILTRKQGKGTFVATHHEAGIQRRFLRLTAESGQKELLEHQLISCVASTASEKIAAELGLSFGEATIEIERLLTFSGRPLIYDIIIVPNKVFKNLNAERIMANRGSMYRMYESEFNVSMIRADERLKAVGATSKVANLLGVKLHEPLLSIERIAFTYGEMPMEWRLGLCVTDNHHYLNQLD